MVDKCDAWIDKTFNCWEIHNNLTIYYLLFFNNTTFDIIYLLFFICDDSKRTIQFFIFI